MVKMTYILIVFFALSSNASKIKNLCDNKEYQIADAKLTSAVKVLKQSKDPWKELALVFKIWEPCKDKFQDEGFIDAIAELVVTRWDKTPDLIDLKAKNPAFYKYVLSSLGNETVGLDRWNKIVNLSKKHCPVKAKEICKDIEHADQASGN